MKSWRVDIVFRKTVLLIRNSMSQFPDWKPTYVHRSDSCTRVYFFKINLLYIHQIDRNVWSLLPWAKPSRRRICTKELKLKAINYETSRHIPFFYEFFLHIIPPPKEKQHITMFFVLLWARHSTQAPPLNLVKCLDTGAAFVGFGSRSIQWWGSAADVDTSVVNHPPVKQVADIEKKGCVLEQTTMWTFLFMRLLPYNSSYFSQKTPWTCPKINVSTTCPT